ncbi:hypothetical protein D3C83_232410 [compost metagenome]
MDPRPAPLTAGPAAMRFEYAYEGEPVRWEATWSEPDAFPAAVRVVLIAAGDEDIHIRVVDIPGGKLLPWRERS